jgi:type IV secretory pathway component VirB8
MDTELSQRLALIEEKVEKILISAEKTRKYFKWTLIISVAFVVLPAIGLIFVIPAFLSSYLGPLQSLTQ